MEDLALRIPRAFVVLTLLVLSACTGSKHAPSLGTGGANAGAAGNGSGGRAGGAGTIGAAGAVGGAGATGGTGATAGTGTAGAAGATGVAGVSGETGASGSNGGAGRGGTTGGAGTTGAAGSSGMSGAGGSASGIECTKADDCVLLSDCCACRAEPKGAVLPSCPAICAKDSCTANQIQANEVTCVLGRCVIARSCNTTRVTCPADPAECPVGTIHSVLDSCWGPCLPPTECRDVTDCSSCGGGEACVRNVEFAITTICVAPAADCHVGNYCTCLVTCPVVCSEKDAGVSCFCPGC
jgi:hypothetical protein